MHHQRRDSREGDPQLEGLWRDHRRDPTEEEQERGKMEMKAIMSDPETYRQFKNHTINCFRMFR